MPGSGSVASLTAELGSPAGARNNEGCGAEACRTGTGAAEDLGVAKVLAGKEWRSVGSSWLCRASLLKYRFQTVFRGLHSPSAGMERNSGGSGSESGGGRESRGELELHVAGSFCAVEPPPLEATATTGTGICLLDAPLEGVGVSASNNFGPEAWRRTAGVGLVQLPAPYSAAQGGRELASPRAAA